uniref:Protein lifeguard 2 n=1 Tax=Astyanax mexicanus TaxID=7994 RepID=A0A8B9LBD7_ASTMX
MPQLLLRRRFIFLGRQTHPAHFYQKGLFHPDAAAARHTRHRLCFYILGISKVLYPNSSWTLFTIQFSVSWDISGSVLLWRFKVISFFSFFFFFAGFNTFFVNNHLIFIQLQNYRRQFPWNLILLTVFTLSMACMLGFISSFYNSRSVVLCLGITAVVCFSVTIFSFQSRVSKH